MMRATADFGFDLTFRREALARLDGERGINAALKAFLSSLRKKADREDWVYDVRVSFSRSEPYSQKQRPSALHFHGVLRAKPGSTMIDYIKEYWNKRFGFVSSEMLPSAEDIIRREEYIASQAEWVRHQVRQPERLDEVR